MCVCRRQLLALREQHGFLLAIDDAHATLVCDRHPCSALLGGAQHRAAAAADAAAEVGELCKKADVVVGTMSKVRMYVCVTVWCV